MVAFVRDPLDLGDAGRALWHRLGSRSLGQGSRSRSRGRLLVIGNGMVGQRFCERLVQSGDSGRFDVRVLSEERTPAYDRVHLGEVLRGRPAEMLILRDLSWYRENGVTLHLADPVARIDRAERRVLTESGQSFEYDTLVLATGSRAVLPPFAVDHEREVMLYRTLDDAERIAREVEASRLGGAPVAVIGAGLLGLEAARAFQNQGCDVVVVEAASQLLPRQLDPDSAAFLLDLLRRAGLSVVLRARIERVERRARGVRLMLAGGESLEVGAVVAAIGARPRDELAREAGLRVAARGGVAIDARMRTSDPFVYAIGECASHASVPEGLVAPGYAMADALVAGLQGRRRALGAQHAVTRLKLDLTEVTVLGSPANAPQERDIVFRAPGVYRRLMVARGRVVSAVAIGEWAELAALQTIVAEGRRLPERDLARFEREGTLASRRVRLAVRSHDAVVCQCAAVSRGALEAAIAAGATTSEALGRTTGAGTLCGGCRPELAALLSEPVEAPARVGRALQAASVIAFVLAAVTLLSSRVRLPARLEDYTVHVAWTESFWKQLSGYGILSVLLGGLLLSVRKRVRRFRYGAYASWRKLHAVLGAASLVALFAHTGFRLGYNMNRALVIVLLISAGTGALVGIASAGATGVARFRAFAVEASRKVHDIAFWLLLPLLAFHILKTYYY